MYEDETSLEIQVRDNGEKINPAFKDKLFESGISTKGEHRGIGLFLVKNRVELYHGTIEIEDFDEEKIFVIMINKESMMDKVLIVEDDPMVALINKRYLQQFRQIEIFGPVSSEEEVFILLRSTKNDLIIMDVFLRKKAV
ncbi:MAG: ATP-binding protein [Turicibacter sanguinis]